MGSLDLRHLCSAGLVRLTRSGLFPSYENTGRYRPSPYQTKAGFKERELVILHYADLRGQLYQDQIRWKQVQALVHGFTQAGSGITKLRMPEVWGTIPVSFDSAKASLPGAFKVAGLDREDVDPGGRFWLFHATGGTRMESLPEPYGKWYQHVLRQPRWGQPVKLRLEIHCRLNYVSDENVSIDVEISGFAPGIVDEVGKRLAERLGLPRALRPTSDYLRKSARFLIAKQPLSLTTLQ